MDISQRVDRDPCILWHLGSRLHLFLCNDGMSIIEVLEWPELGFQPKAECEHCLAKGGDLVGCWECEYKGYRSLTEEEEDEIDYNHADRKNSETNIAGSDQNRGQ